MQVCHIDIYRKVTLDLFMFLETSDQDLSDALGFRFLQSFYPPKSAVEVCPNLQFVMK